MSSNPIQFSYLDAGDGDRSVTAFVPGEYARSADASHPNFEKIVEGLFANDPNVFDLFDIAQSVANKFQRLSERVTLGSDRQLYFDGEIVDNAIVGHIVRFLDQGVEDWRSLVAFFENVQQNPNEHSREQLYTWLNDRNFTITPTGMIVGYKGVKNGSDGTFLSVHSGKAIVDGVVVNGQIPNNVGSVIEMPRSEVQHNPSVGCHTGLHVGTFEYASSFGSSVLEIHVNPRDVVSVPTDCSWAKVRCCRYLVAGIVEKAYDTPLVRDYGVDYVDGSGVWGDQEDQDDPDYCEFCEYGECTYEC